jgi:hypothetical protein
MHGFGTYIICKIFEQDHRTLTQRPALTNKVVENIVPYASQKTGQ